MAQYLFVSLEGLKMNRKIVVLIFLAILSLNTIVTAAINMNNTPEQASIQMDDYDPLVDINITVDILGIRALDEIDSQSDPDFFIKVFINEEEFTSDTWNDDKYLYDCFTVTKNVPDDVQNVDIKIQLWDWCSEGNKLCDISKEKNSENAGFDVNLVYNLATGLWSGDDYNIGDSSGYGRVCGCGDGSIYENEYDCEVWFNIYQNDFDNDGLAYWVENFVYLTDPTVDNTGEDTDMDAIPIEWEHRYGFNPLIWDDHKNMDPDGDSIDNYEEFLTSDLASDPFRKDLFLEVDYMEDYLDGEQRIVTEEAKELVKNPYHRRNIVFHFDTDICGGEIIPYTQESTFEEVQQIWRDYFLHNDENNWRRGVFHYALYVHDITPGGFAFSGDVEPYWGYIPGTNSFVISNLHMDKKVKWVPGGRDHVYASLIVHELGHNFGIRFGNPLGCDNPLTRTPFIIGRFIWRNYKSVMNYRYTYYILDYSDGSHGKRDFDDWEEIDLTYFEIPN